VSIVPSAIENVKSVLFNPAVTGVFSELDSGDFYGNLCIY
jgi:hypothetical protein